MSPICILIKNKFAQSVYATFRCIFDKQTKYEWSACSTFVCILVNGLDLHNQLAAQLYFEKQIEFASSACTKKFYVPKQICIIIKLPHLSLYAAKQIIFNLQYQLKPQHL